MLGLFIIINNVLLLVSGFFPSFQASSKSSNTDARQTSEEQHDQEEEGGGGQNDIRELLKYKLTQANISSSSHCLLFSGAGSRACFWLQRLRLP